MHENSNLEEVELYEYTGKKNPLYWRKAAQVLSKTVLEKVSVCVCPSVCVLEYFYILLRNKKNEAPFVFFQLRKRKLTFSP